MIGNGKLYKTLFVVLFFHSFIAFSQSSVLDKKISLQCENQPLGSVLKLIEKQLDVNFVYVSSLFNSNKLISISEQNTTFKLIFRQLFPDKNIEFYAIGKNIVLSKTKPKTIPKKVNNNTSIVKERNPDLVSIPIHDTLLVTFRDTLSFVKHDTIIKESTHQVPSTISQKKSMGNLYIGASTEYDFTNEKLLQGSASSSVFNQVQKSEKINASIAGGISIGYRGKSFGLQSGLGFKNKSWSTAYNYQAIKTDSSKVVGYTETSTWNIKPTQPQQPPFSKNPITISDSTLVITRTPIYQKDTIKEKYSSINKASYLVIPLQLNYYHLFFNKVELQLGVGTELMLLYYSQGQTLVSDNAPLDDINKYLKDYYMRFKTSLGINYNITANQSLALQTSYGLNVTPVFRSDYPIKRNENTSSIGICYSWNFISP